MANRLLHKCPADLFYRFYEVTNKEPYRLMAVSALREQSEMILGDLRSGSVMNSFCMNENVY